MRNKLIKLVLSCDGITSIEYSFIGVCMSVALLYILDDSGFMQSLSMFWTDIARGVNGSLNG